MQCSIRIVASCVVATLPRPAWPQVTGTLPPPDSVVALRDVAVIPMDSDHVLEHYTLLVRDGRIAALGPVAAITVPSGATVIEGRGRYVLPGLADMHTHVDRPELLPLFLAAGVTTVLNMGLARPEFVTQTRHDLAHGRLLGPQVFVAFMIDGPGDPGPEYVPPCESDARDAVDRAKLLGYDFIKVYSRLQPAIYAAVLDEAKRQGMPVVGHIPPAVGLQQSLASGQVMIAHAEEFFKTYLQGQPDESRIARAAALTRAAGAYVTPNLSFFAFLAARTADPALVDTALSWPAAALLPPDIRGNWLAARAAHPSDRLVAELGVVRRLTRALSDSGVPLLAGTDTPGAGMVPGASLDDDLRELVAAGLTPFQALSAATRVPGRFIHAYVPSAEQFGTIAPGVRADLIMVDRNPLQDVSRVRNPAGVMVGGRWLTPGQLAQAVRAPARAYQRVTRAETEFRSDVRRGGAAAAIRRYRARPPGAALLPETFVNALGYQELAAQKLDDAIALFAFNAEAHPDSWNAFDSLGEAYAAAGQTDLAILSYRRSLALNLRNAGAVRALTKLTHR